MEASTTPAGGLDALNEAWRQSLEQLLRVSPGRLQLLQPLAPSPTDSPALWAQLDAVPTAETVTRGTPAATSFAVTYGSVILNLKPPLPVALERALGDYYAPWTEYVASGPPMPAGGLPDLYRAWATAHIPDPAITQAGLTALLQMLHAPVPAAVSMYKAAQAAGNGFAYTASIHDLDTALESAASFSVSLSLPPGAPGGSAGAGGTGTTGSTDSSTDDTGAGAAATLYAASGGDGGGAGVADPAPAPFGPDPTGSLTAQLLRSNLQVKVQFKKLLSLAAGPLARAASTAPLSSYTPWYNGAVLSMAYQTSDNVLWNKTPPTWSQTFGPGGTLPRVCSSLVVVDGISVQITSDAVLDAAAQRQLQQAVTAGVWPFFGTAEGGWTAVVRVGTSGHPSIQMACPQGNPQLLARVVTPIAAALGISS